MTVRLTILHTNDLHGRLDAAGAALLRDTKAAAEPALLLDSGDAVACGNMGFHRGGEPDHDWMNQAGYDAGTLGNREFHLCQFAQRLKLGRAGFPLVCANLAGRGIFGELASHVVLEPVEGLRIRVFGLLRDMVGGPPAAWISPARFRDPVAVAREQTVAGDESALCVCLSHLGLAEDRRLAAEVDGLDLILGGHSHTPLEPPERVGRCWIGQNRPYAGTFTRYRLSIEDGVLVDAAAEVVPWLQDGRAA